MLPLSRRRTQSRLRADTRCYTKGRGFLAIRSTHLRVAKRLSSHCLRIWRGKLAESFLDRERWTHLAQLLSFKEYARRLWYILDFRWGWDRFSRRWTRRTRYLSWFLIDSGQGCVHICNVEISRLENHKENLQHVIATMSELSLALCILPSYATSSSPPSRANH